MISKILVAVDVSKSADKAFEYACDLANKAGASLLILHVFEELGTVGYSINKELELDKRDVTKISIKSQKIIDADIRRCDRS